MRVYGETPEQLSSQPRFFFGEAGTGPSMALPVNPGPSSTRAGGVGRGSFNAMSVSPGSGGSSSDGDGIEERPWEGGGGSAHPSLVPGVLGLGLATLGIGVLLTSKGSAGKRLIGLGFLGLGLAFGALAAGAFLWPVFFQVLGAVLMGLSVALAIKGSQDLEREKSKPQKWNCEKYPEMCEESK